MRRFRAANLAHALTNVERATYRLDIPDSAYQPGEVTARDWLGQALGELRESVDEMGLSTILTQQINRVIRAVEYKTPQTPPSNLAVMIGELRSNVLLEMSPFLYFAVPPVRRVFYLDPPLWFGRATLDRFPSIEGDVRDACQCFALTQWTACVFHAMRIVEHGLHALVADLKIAGPTDLENWKVVIDQIEKQIRAMEQEPKSIDKSERVQFYSEAAIQFRYFKDAWRNHVSHSRASYNEATANSVLTAVKTFMGHLASERPWQSRGTPPPQPPNAGPSTPRI